MIDLESPTADAVVQAIHAGDPLTLRRLLRANPGMATARFGAADPRGAELTLLHIATDPPGHYPHGAETVAVLVEAGVDVSAPCTGPHAETPLHWAASSNDLDALDALLDAGADIEAPGCGLLRRYPAGGRRRLRAVAGGTAPNRTRGTDHPLASSGAGLAVTHPRLLSGQGAPRRGRDQHRFLVCLPRRPIQRCVLPPA